MMRVVSVGLVALIVVPGLAVAQGSSRFDGKYYVTPSRHTLKATGAGGSAKGPQFNPKEFKLDEKATWKAKPKARTVAP